MYTLLKPLSVRNILLEKNIVIFTTRQFRQIFQLDQYKTKYECEKLTKEGLFIRLKKGLYTLSTDMPSDEEIANALYKPSYISLEYALSYYNILPEMVYTVTSITTKPTRNFDANEKMFSYNTIKKEAFTGYNPIKRDDKIILMAEPEKAFVDYMYFISMNIKENNDRLNTINLDKKKIKEYSLLFNRNSLNNIIKPSL